MDRPSPTRAELRTAQGLRLVFEQLLRELEPPRIDWPALEARVGTATVEEGIAELQAEFERAAVPPDDYGLDEWLTRELEIDFDAQALAPEAAALLAEISIRWIVLVGRLRDPRRALDLANAAMAVAIDPPQRVRVALALALSLVGYGRGNVPVGEAIAQAFAALVQARALGAEDEAATYMELRVRCFAGRASELPVRRRLRELAAASRLADDLLARSDDERVRDEVAAEKTRLAADRERLASLGWLHRLVGFAPDS